MAFYANRWTGAPAGLNATSRLVDPDCDCVRAGDWRGADRPWFSPDWDDAVSLNLIGRAALFGGIAALLALAVLTDIFERV